MNVVYDNWKNRTVSFRMYFNWLFLLILLKRPWQCNTWLYLANKPIPLLFYNACYQFLMHLNELKTSCYKDEETDNINITFKICFFLLHHTFVNISFIDSLHQLYGQHLQCHCWSFELQFIICFRFVLE